MARATAKTVREFFESGENGRKVSLTEFKALKESDGISEDNGYGDLAEGIGNGTLTY